MNSDDETYILLLLSDSNLPTGAFVASSGLESYMKHGFGSNDPTAFIRDSMASYARSALPFVSDAYRLVSLYREMDVQGSSLDQSSSKLLSDIVALEELYETMMLNHVARRASKSQGVALLTLYTKALSPPSSFPLESDAKGVHEQMSTFFTQFKTMVRREDAHGHLPTCWGALTAALGLTLERSCYLHLFLHARSLLSASVRLNDIGPYNAQQILLHAVRPLVAAETSRCRSLTTGSIPHLIDDGAFDETIHGPANTWPLGEILTARHDLQHSRIFNS
ncbi:urease accessory protein UreF [Guyanagaster necrorhizus]|uniref:Urease accessory protein UreF n=1 Tax=Guyanagaster necrorhizus TaxID=856835 RepID=A0A9P7VWP5_9AGAR|nr:urease accessory protein UreF [Guyanagaster necrorhizus MCA 3950]KAG7447554.1 urease accessory protein UreF [Guyanagaster necrorhizus MCA 3950]